MNQNCISILFLSLGIIVVVINNIGFIAGAYTKEENNALERFRPMVADLLYKDFMKADIYLIPFLRARKLDLNKAKEMVQKNVEWRKANKIDTILQEDFSTFEKDFPYIVDGVDKKGRPLIIILVGAYNIRKAVLAGQLDQFNRYLDRTFELAREYAFAKNKTQGVAILDLYGLNRKTQACLNCLPVFIHFTKTYENHYPLLCKTFIFINAPKIFEVIQDAIRPFQSQASTDATKVFGLNKDEWSKALLRDINPDQLPVRFGGTKILKNKGEIIQ